MCVQKNYFKGEKITMKKQQLNDQRNNLVNVRFNDEELSKLKNMAKESNRPLSGFIREAALNTTVKHIYNGKEIIAEIGKLHRHFQNYHNDMASRVQSLQNSIDDNSRLLHHYNGINSADFNNTFNLQRTNINTAVKTIMAHYSETQRKAEEDLHSIIEPIV